MNVLTKTEDDKSVLQWGGVAGILGSILFILDFVFVGVFIGLDAAEHPGWVMRFPDISGARIVENSLFLVVLILWVFHFLALYYALRRSNFAPALFGSVLGILGLAVLAAEALPHVAQAPISNLYHAPGATTQEQATLVFLWEATQGILEAMFIAGLVLLPISLILLGAAMLRTSAFGKGLGGVTVVLGVFGVLAALLLLVEPTSELGGMVGVFALIGFHFVLGWKVYRLARVP